MIGSLLILSSSPGSTCCHRWPSEPPGRARSTTSKAIALPVLTLLGATLASSVRMVRAGMIETLATDYIQMARLNGFGGAHRRLARALRNALAPSVQIFAQNIMYLVGGILVVEYLFAFPGIGKELVDSVAIRDVRAVQSIAMVIAAITIGLNLLADLIVLLLVPRLRTPR